ATLETPFLIDPDTGSSRSYADVAREIERVAAGLVRDHALRKWDVVGIYSPNLIEYGARGTVSPANPAYTVEELTYQLRDSGATYLFTTAELLDTALAAAQAAGIPAARTYLLETALSAAQPAARRGLRTLRELGAGAGAFSPLPLVAFSREELRERPAFLCYSSGTTGRPKGVVTTHRNMIAAVVQIEQAHKSDGSFIEGDCTISVLPMYHMYGLNFFTHYLIHTMGRLVVLQKFEFVTFLKLLEKYECGTACIVPPMVLALAKHPAVDTVRLPKLRSLLSGAAPLSLELTQEVRNRLPHVAVVQGYGMTETSP
ncbi:hypothetical protein HK405_000131, partial [Cladochytrium tenue]